MNFNQLCSINYGITHQKRFLTSQELQSLLKTNTNSAPRVFLFDPFCINIIRLVPQHWPGSHNINSSTSKSKWPIFTTDYYFGTLLVLQWNALAQIQPVNNGVCDRAYK